MKISPTAKKIFILGFIIIPIFISTSVSFLIYHYETPLIREGYFTLQQSLILINLTTILVFGIIFISTYSSLKRNLKQFKSKFSNLDTIIKAIEYSQVSNVTDITIKKTQYERIAYDSGIYVLGNGNYVYWLENVRVPELSYLHYLITKKGDEHNKRNEEEEANKRTESIIKMMKQQED